MKRVVPVKVEYTHITLVSAPYDLRNLYLFSHEQISQEHRMYGIEIGRGEKGNAIIRCLVIINIDDDSMELATKKMALTI